MKIKFLFSKNLAKTASHKIFFVISWMSRDSG